MSLPYKNEVLEKKDWLESIHSTTRIHQIRLVGSRIHRTDQPWSDYDLVYIYSGDVMISNQTHREDVDGTQLSFVGRHVDSLEDVLRISFLKWEYLRSPMIYFDDGSLTDFVFDDLMTLETMLEDMSGYAVKVGRRRDDQIIWKYYARAIVIAMKMIWIRQNGSHLYPLDVWDLIVAVQFSIPLDAINAALSNSANGKVTGDPLIYNWLESTMEKFL